MTKNNKENIIQPAQSSFEETRDADRKAVEGVEIFDDFDPAEEKKNREKRNITENVDKKTDFVQVSNNNDSITEKKVEEKENIVLKLSQDISDKLPDGFNINEIGSIDLSEAEKIAGEDILFLTEDDLIEGLEDLDLIPLDDEAIDQSQKKPAYTEAGTDQTVSGESYDDDQQDALQTSHASSETAEHDTPVMKNIPVEEDEDLEIFVFEDENGQGSDKPEQTADAGNEQPEKDSGTFKEADYQTEEYIDSELQAEEDHQPQKQTTEESLEHNTLPDKNETVPEPPVVTEEPVSVDSSIEEDTLPVFEQSQTEELPEQKTDEQLHVFTDSDISPETVSGDTAGSEKISEDKKIPDEVFAFIDEDLAVVSSPAGTADTVRTTHPAPLEQTQNEQQYQADDLNEEAETTVHQDSETGREVRTYDIIKEDLPESMQALDMVNPRVKFIDDDGIEKPVVELLSLFEEGDLEKIDANIVEIAEGEVKFLQEGDPKKRRRLIDAEKKEELLKDVYIDFDDDYYYADSDIDFIHSAVIEDDYSEYIRKIDTLYGNDQTDKVSTAVELLGLSEDEFELINDRLFAPEYESVDLDALYDQLVDDILGSAIHIEDRECRYILPENDSITVDEKESIEEDLYAKSALIIEEDIAEIAANLKKRTSSASPVEAKAEPVYEESEDEIIDITNDIVILEDEHDVDRFIQDLPEEKQDDMKKLFQYLDGLFEKLPEGTIKNFADSEYFDLYVKVLNEMGL